MERAALESIRKAVKAAQQVTHSTELDSCDIDDIDEMIISVEQELGRSNPNKNTLSTYLNSLSRSLRSHPPARQVCADLDAAMREGGLPMT